MDFLISSETAGVYALGLTHYTCGNMKMAVNDPAHPVQCNLTIEPVGQPIDLGNGIYGQEFLIAGTVTYCPCGGCKGEVNASPKPITYYVNNGCGCCRAQKPCTNQIAITTSIEVTAGA